jgi:hypothetical protein
MRVRWLIISAGLLAGCASKPATTTYQTQSNLETSSSALVFDPPIAMNEPAIDLTRSTHGEAAYAGYEDTTTTFFYIHTDDRQTTDSTDRFVREGYSEKVGATRR